jgi:hypothetical protein
MGLAEALQAVPEPEPMVRCGIYYLREQLDGEDLRVFNETLKQLASTPGNERKNGKSGLTARWFAEVLQANGHNISKSTVQRHTTGGCTCGVI